jgi:hypothetical protein
VRRSPGGLLLVIAGVFVALAIGSMWLQRVAFTPSTSSSAARAVIADEAIRDQVVTVVATAGAPALGVSVENLREYVDHVVRVPAAAPLMSRFLAEGHAALLGETDDPVRIDASEQVTLVRDERVGEADPITIPVREVGSMAFLDGWLTWFALGCAGIGIVTLLAGVVLRPERGEGTFALAVTLASIGISIFVFGYVVPLLVLPMFSDDPWMGLFARMADHRRNITLLLSVLSIGLAAVVVLGTGSRRDRRQHSTPLNVARYRDDRSWSR